MLQMLDTHWKDHLAAMDHLRQSIHLRGYAQKNPAQEYKRESFDMFASMMEGLKYEVVSTLSQLKVAPETQIPAYSQAPELHFSHAEFNGLPVDPGADMQRDPSGDVAVAEEDPLQPFVRNDRKVGRNEPCPCGSGKKYKQCHGRLT
jgi:preprotein translocase subunit SecA